MGIPGGPNITTDPSTDIGLIRLLITDVDPASPLFTDVEITALLTAEGGSVKRAAALALETIARSEVLISKRISTQDLSVDGPAVAAELRASAAALREQADTGGSDDGYGLDIVAAWTCPPSVPWGGSCL